MSAELHTKSHDQIHQEYLQKTSTYIRNAVLRTQDAHIHFQYNSESTRQTQLDDLRQQLNTLSPTDTSQHETLQQQHDIRTQTLNRLKQKHTHFADTGYSALESIYTTEDQSTPIEDLITEITQQYTDDAIETSSIDQLAQALYQSIHQASQDLSQHFPDLLSHRRPRHRQKNPHQSNTKSTTRHHSSDVLQIPTRSKCQLH